MKLTSISKSQKIGLVVIAVLIVCALWQLGKFDNSPKEDFTKGVYRITSSNNSKAEPQSLATMKELKLKPAKDATKQDLVFLPFSGWFEHIHPQINELAKCNAATLFAGEEYTNKMLKVENKLAEQLHRLLGSIESEANLYDLEIEYRSAWWANKGYFEGVAKTTNSSIEEVAVVQAEDCIKRHYDD